MAGIELVLFLDQENYMLNKMTQSSGAKIVVHDPGLSPLLDEFAIDLQPGTATSIALQVVSTCVVVKFEKASDDFNYLDLGQL